MKCFYGISVVYLAISGVGTIVTMGTLVATLFYNAPFYTPVIAIILLMPLFKIVEKKYGKAAVSPYVPHPDGRGPSKKTVIALLAAIFVPTIIFGTIIGNRISNQESEQKNALSECNSPGQDQKNIDGCTYLIKNAKDGNANIAAFYNNRGVAYLRSQRFELALADFDKALSLRTDYENAQLGRCAALAGAKKYEAAVTECGKTIKQHPDQLALYLVRGAALSEIGKSQSALSDFERVIAASPDNTLLANALNGRCEAELILEQTQPALTDCNRALELAPGEAELFDTRAFLFIKMGKYSEARADFDKALTLHPALPSSLYGRALLERHNGDAGAAEADFSAAKAASPDLATDIARYNLKL